MVHNFPLPISTPVPRRLQDLFLHQAQRHPEKVFMAHRQEDGSWQTWTWNAIAQNALTLAAHLHNLGARKGDCIVVRARNHPLWCIAELAILFNESIVVPSYAGFSRQNYQHIQDITKARFVICDEGLSPDPLLGINWQVVPIGKLFAITGPDVRDRPLPKRASKRTSPDETACIIFTSGTSGDPRGVVLSHRALLSNAWAARSAIDTTRLMNVDRHRFYSFLPLAHAYEHIAGLWLPITLGAEIYYPQSSETIISDMADAAPTLVSAVPRLFETIRGLMLKRLAESSPLRVALLRRALRYAEHHYSGWENVPGYLRIIQMAEFAILRRLLNRIARQRFGTRLMSFICGGGALHPKIEQLMLALNIQLLQGYGLTEAAPVISVNLPGKHRFGSVGQALPGTKIRIASDGEVLVGGDQLMNCYFHDPQASKSALKKGWLYTGDIGHVDNDGYLFLTDRKKDIIVNSGGQNIAPQFLETNLELEPEILQAYVAGNDKPHLVAVIVPDPAGAPSKQALLKAISTANQRVLSYQRIRSYVLADTAFATENRMLTPTLKLRREVIHTTYITRLDALYRNK